jgi:hypothetical protein
MCPSGLIPALVYGGSDLATGIYIGGGPIFRPHRATPFALALRPRRVPHLGTLLAPNRSPNGYRA